MKCDPEILRSITMWIEADDQFDGWSRRQIQPGDDGGILVFDERLEWQVFRYHMHQLASRGLVDGDTESLPRNLIIRGLTPAGHDFLDCVRNKTVWEKTKAIGTSAGGWTLDTLIDVARSIVKQKLAGALAGLSGLTL